MYPLAVLCRTDAFDFAYILGNYGHARSQGGRQPAAAKPPLYISYVYLFVFSIYIYRSTKTGFKKNPDGLALEPWLTLASFLNYNG